MNLEFPQQIFEEYATIKFNENPSSESRVVPCGKTDRHEVCSRFSKVCERAQKHSSGDCHVQINWQNYGERCLQEKLVFILKQVLENAS
jgi:hypothetical protein